MSLLSSLPLLVRVARRNLLTRGRGVSAGWAMGRLAAGVLAAIVAIPGTGTEMAYAQQWCDPVKPTKLRADDGVAGDRFGSAVSFDGDTIVIGAPMSDYNGTDSGSAYVYRFDGSNWVQEAKLTPSDGAAVDQFGRAVSISGDIILVGAYLDDDRGTSSGSAYIYRFNGTSWVQEAKLLAADGAENDNFGRSVSISGDTAVVGARGDDDNGVNSGSVYVFRFNGLSWVQEAKLIPADGGQGGEFGYSVSISGNSIIIGAAFDNDNGGDSGSAYIYRFDGTNWMQEAKLVSSDGANGDQFGWSVSISGNTSIVGSPGDDDNGLSSGSAYIFYFDGIDWVQQDKLLASDDETWLDLFGYSVSISGNVAVVGAPFNKGDGTDAGASYVFHPDGLKWVQKTRLPTIGGTGSARFGWSVSVSGSSAVNGASRGRADDFDTGTAYVYDVSGVCPADLTDDCEVDTIDFLAFLGAWSIGDPLADWNGDGEINTIDFLAYLDDWVAGCF